jgi:hypothetical protein
MKTSEKSIKFSNPLTNFVEQGPSWEANSGSPSQEINPPIYGTPKSITVFTRPANFEALALCNIS